MSRPSAPVSAPSAPASSAIAPAFVGSFEAAAAADDARTGGWAAKAEAEAAAQAQKTEAAARARAQAQVEEAALLKFPLALGLHPRFHLEVLFLPLKITNIRVITRGGLPLK